MTKVFPIRERYSVVHQVVVVSLLSVLKAPGWNDLPSPAARKSFDTRPFSSF
jgi:hypothetical protein